jgi:hypothetical protein
MPYLLAFVAGIVGAAVGWAAVAAATVVIAGYMGVSDFEGARSMLAVFGTGPLGGLAGLVAGVALVLRRRGGHGAAGIALRTPLVVGAIAAAAAGGLWWMYETRPVLNTNGPAPQLAFEVRLPAGLAPPPGGGLRAELHTERNRMPARLAEAPARSEDGRAVLAGDVEVYYRSGWRLLEVRLPGQADRLFKLDLPASPRRSTPFGRWERAQYVAGPDAQPRPAGADEGFEIRYRMIWPE